MTGRIAASLWTRPATGTAGGVPTGPRARISPHDRDAQRRSLHLENTLADDLAARGYRVHQNPNRDERLQAAARTGDDIDPDKTPDYLIEGHVFDCYAPTAHKAPRGIWDEVAKKIDKRQTQRVVLNLEEWQGNLDELHDQFTRWPLDGLLELVAVTRQGPIVHIPTTHR